jgi:hypothetical protein
MARLDHKAELDVNPQHLVLLSVVGIGLEASTSGPVAFQGNLGFLACNTRAFSETVSTI